MFGTDQMAIQRQILRCMLVLMFATFTVPRTAIAQDVSLAGARSETATPELLFEAAGQKMDTGGGFLYWRYFRSGPFVAAAGTDAATATGYIQRYPIGGGRETRIADLAIEYHGFKASDDRACRNRRRRHRPGC